MSDPPPLRPVAIGTLGGERLVAWSDHRDGLELRTADNEVRERFEVPHQRDVRAHRFVLDRYLVVTCGNTVLATSARVFDATSGRWTLEIDDFQDEIGVVSTHPRSPRVAFATDTAGLRVWDLERGKLDHVIEGVLPDHVAYHPTRPVLAMVENYATMHSQLQLMNEDGTGRRELPWPHSDVTALAWLDERRVAFAGVGEWLACWDTESGDVDILDSILHWDTSDVADLCAVDRDHVCTLGGPGKATLVRLSSREKRVFDGVHVIEADRAEPGLFLARMTGLERVTV